MLRRAVVSSFVLLAAGGTALAQPAWGLAALMQSMAQIRSSSATFTERKTLPMLSAPLLASGTLDYVAPDYVRKTTTAPVKQDFVLSQGKVMLSGGPGDQVHRFSLTQNPEIGGLTEAIRGTLAGDLQALENLYVLTLSGPQTRWQLVLQPKDPGLRHFVAWIAIHGAANRITEIDTENGDASHSEMRISEDKLVAR